MEGEAMKGKLVTAGAALLIATLLPVAVCAAGGGGVFYGLQTPEYPFLNSHQLDRHRRIEVQRAAG